MKKENIADGLKLSKDALFGFSRLSVNGNSEVYVENYKSIVEYEDGCIRLLTKNGYINICGVALQIKYYTDEEIYIKGRIDKIEFF